MKYSVPDGRIVPFYTMKCIHRARIEKQFAKTFYEWRAEHKPSQVEEDSISKPFAANQ